MKAVWPRVKAVRQMNFKQFAFLTGHCDAHWAFLDLRNYPNK